MQVLHTRMCLKTYKSCSCTQKNAKWCHRHNSDQLKAQNKCKEANVTMPHTVLSKKSTVFVNKTLIYRSLNKIHSPRVLQCHTNCSWIGNLCNSLINNLTRDRQNFDRSWIDQHLGMLCFYKNIRTSNFVDNTHFDRISVCNPALQ
jgi:hypothetical protein